MATALAPVLPPSTLLLLGSGGHLRPKPCCLLKYQYVPDILERRGPYRAAHLEGANQKAAEKKLVLAGALADPVDGAVFIFRNSSKVCGTLLPGGGHMAFTHPPPPPPTPASRAYAAAHAPVLAQGLSPP